MTEHLQASGMIRVFFGRPRQDGNGHLVFFASKKLAEAGTPQQSFIRSEGARIAVAQRHPHVVCEHAVPFGHGGHDRGDQAVLNGESFDANKLVLAWQGSDRSVDYHKSVSPSAPVSVVPG